MIKKKFSFHSLYFELIIAVVISIAINVALFFGLQFINFRVAYSYIGEKYNAVQIKHATEDLQAYIIDNNLNSFDYESLYEWSEKHPQAYFYTKIDGETYFNSSVYSFYKNLENSANHLTEEQLDEINNIYESDEEDNTMVEYPISFSDTTGSLFISGYYNYSLYETVSSFDLLVASILTIVLLVLIIRTKIHYINEIIGGIHVFEGGNLNYNIPIKGRDELTDIANNLNTMSVSLSQQMENEKKALQANNSLVTALSHDLRTPLTTQMGYLEILKEHHYASDDEHDKYVQTALDTCHQIKEMSDRLFEYFLAFDPHPERSKDTLTTYDGMEYFMQIIGELSLPLIEHGFTFEYKEPTESFLIDINSDDILRVFNNVFTNIDKYADENSPVSIDISSSSDYATVAISNKIRQIPRKNESAKIGLISISSLMKRQGGSSVTRTTSDIFTIELKFPIK